MIILLAQVKHFRQSKTYNDNVTFCWKLRIKICGLRIGFVFFMDAKNHKPPKEEIHKLGIFKI